MYVNFFLLKTNVTFLFLPSIYNQHSLKSWHFEILTSHGENGGNFGNSEKFSHIC